MSREIPDHKTEKATKLPTCLLMGNPTEKTQICIIWQGLRLPLNARSKFSEAPGPHKGTSVLPPS